MSKGDWLRKQPHCLHVRNPEFPPAPNLAPEREPSSSTATQTRKSHLYAIACAVNLWKEALRLQLLSLGPDFPLLPSQSPNGPAKRRQKPPRPPVLSMKS